MSAQKWGHKQTGRGLFQFLLVVVASTAAPGFAQAQSPCAGGCPSEGVILVQAPRAGGGGHVVCYGMGCAGILENLRGGAGHGVPLNTDEGLIEDPPVDAQVFCTELRQSKPPACDLNNPPSSAAVPGSGYHSNGCGDGTLLSEVGGMVAGVGLAGYQGNLNHPFPGISFYSACMEHDGCYSRQLLAQGQCDQNFNIGLRGSCSATSSHFQGCAALADRFADAVQLFGSAAHDRAARNRMCAEWARDMLANACPQ